MPNHAHTPRGAPVLVLNGPDPGPLGLREPTVYGRGALADAAICGAGSHGYAMALTHLAQLPEENR
ncbi:MULTISPECIES: type II 3-dehydroquinate dehydratase [Streptomyces]|uniref:hypothetical protein n=1 Tax=Streptomyces TaxID=1883 RepID=UPI000F54E48F|nr:MULTISPECIES: hypothetical protein [unclassified Streptomyces]MDX3061400.1 hypothetical protein [Streptomyces sp. ND04-05B]RPK75543.1 3-dehydroquinate dehydratase [Streptomyces sp. ADI97-07]